MGLCFNMGLNTNTKGEIIEETQVSTVRCHISQTTYASYNLVGSIISSLFILGLAFPVVPLSTDLYSPSQLSFFLSLVLCTCTKVRRRYSCERRPYSDAEAGGVRSYVDSSINGGGKYSLGEYSLGKSNILQGFLHKWRRARGVRHTKVPPTMEVAPRLQLREATAPFSPAVYTCLLNRVLMSVNFRNLLYLFVFKPSVLLSN